MQKFGVFPGAYKLLWADPAPPQVKVKELNDAKTDPKIMEDLFASTYWESSLDPTQELPGQCGRHTITQASHMRIIAGLSSTLGACDMFLRHQKYLAAHVCCKSRRQWD